MEKILDKKRIDDWINALTGWEILTPALEDGVWAYRPVSGAIRLDHTNTAQPPKGLAFPQREVFFSFEQIKGEAPRLTQILPDAKQRAVFGVRPCDGRGTVRMDKVFSDHAADIYYQSRRKNIVYVGLACNQPPGANCFCLSVGGSPISSDGLDVLLTDLEDRYFVTAVTEAGKALIAAAGGLLAEPAANDRAQVEKVHAQAVAHPQRAIDKPNETPAKLKASFKSPLWEELARACIGCGICTFLCPTCHCFDINDEVTGSAPMRGSRVRTWDNCQFPDFTMHSSGHNPRENSGARLRQRVCHKFQYFFENFGMHQCTGCGRCITGCPVGIDIVSVVNKVVEHAG
ncbi:MAG: 4Fe-4S dicluster domain-containing protein [Sulfuricellaceae bacterium]